MMKVPVRETIGVAWRFTLENFSAIVGLIWLPMLLIVGLDFLQSRVLVNEEAQGADIIRIVAYTIGALLLYAIMYVAVTEQALGLRQGRKFVHLSLGLPEFRLFGALLVFALLMMFFFLAVVLISGGLSYVGRSIGGTLVAQAAEAWFMLLGLGFILFCIVRLGFLLIPSVVAERRVSLERSWVLTKGNFWRILAVNLVLLLPLAMFGLFVVLLFMADDFAELQSKLMEGMSQKAFAAAFDQVIAAHKPHMAVVTFFLSPFVTGFTLGASAYAYGLLTRRADAPEPEALP